MSLADLAKQHRLAAGLTQEELAEKAEVSARTISDVERGLRTRIYRDTAGRLASALALEGPDRADFLSSARAQPGAEPVRAGLPIAPTRLVGRAWEVSAVADLLQARALRLVTLTGPGGVGKTRLALEVASRVDPDAVFVDLGEINDARLVVPAIARAVGLPGRGEPSLERIVEHIDDAPRMILLDTFEHVLEAAADIARLLASTPRLMLLVTSREALRIRGEHVFVVPALDQGATGSAVELFCERAVAASPSTTIDVEVAEEICRRLSGLPLAIELAAARARHIALPVLCEQLRSALEVLTEGPRDLPPRQRTMRETIAWSYDLLSPAERSTFRDLCAFSGGWTLEDAAIVCSTDALTGCSALWDKNLIVREGDRYQMLDVIREFGLEMGLEPAASERHLAAYVSLAERAEPELGGAEQRAWIERLSRERANIRVALEYALRIRDGERAMRLAGAVWRFWLLHGDLSEGRSMLRRALALDLSAKGRSKGLWGLGWLAYHQGDHDEAEWSSARMMEIATEDAVEQRNALTIQGIVQLAKGEARAAIPTLRRCVELLRGRQLDWLFATSLLNLGMALVHARDPHAAGTLARAGELYESIGDEHFVARATLYSGYDALLGADLEAAARCARDAVIAFWELDDSWGTAEGLELSAAIAASSGRAELAATIAGAAESFRTTITSAPFPLDAAVVDRFLERIRGPANDGAWEQWSEIGRRMRIDNAIELATSL